MSKYIKILIILFVSVLWGQTQNLKLSFDNSAQNLYVRKAIALENRELISDTTITIESKEHAVLNYMRPMIKRGNSLVIRLLFDDPQYRYVADVQIPLSDSKHKKVNYQQIKLCILRNGNLTRGGYILTPGAGAVKLKKIGNDSYNVFFDLKKIPQPYPGVGKWSLKGDVIAEVSQNPSGIYLVKRPHKGISKSHLKHMEIAGVLGFIILALALSQ